MPHVHDLYDFTSSAYIFYGDQILLIHHKRLNFWLGPGGHIELDEEPLQTLWREIEEETGLSKKDLRLIEPYGSSAHIKPSHGFYSLPLPFDMFVVDYNGDPSHKHIDLSYLLISLTDKVVPQDKEINDIGWFDEAAMQKLLDQGLMPEETYERAMLARKLLKNQAKK